MCSDNRVVRASASVTVDCGLIPCRVKPMTQFAASLLDVQYLRDSAKNKPASLLVGLLQLTGLRRFIVVDRWPVTPKRARYSAWIAFSC